MVESSTDAWEQLCLAFKQARRVLEPEETEREGVLAQVHPTPDYGLLRAWLESRKLDAESVHLWSAAEAYWIVLHWLDRQEGRL